MIALATNIRSVQPDVERRKTTAVPGRLGAAVVFVACPDCGSSGQWLGLLCTGCGGLRRITTTLPAIEQDADGLTGQHDTGVHVAVPSPGLAGAEWVTQSLRPMRTVSNGPAFGRNLGPQGEFF